MEGFLTIDVQSTNLTVRAYKRILAVCGCDFVALKCGESEEGFSTIKKVNSRTEAMGLSDNDCAAMLLN